MSVLVELWEAGKLRKHFIAKAVVIGAALACGASGARAQEKMTIGISYQNLAFPYVAALQKAAENACKALDVNCVEADAVNDTNKELNNVESMLSKGINCLAFEAASLDASVASIVAANKKGVPVVQFNGKASGGDYVTFIGSAQRIPASSSASSSKGCSRSPARTSFVESTCAGSLAKSPTSRATMG